MSAAVSTRHSKSGATSLLNTTSMSKSKPSGLAPPASPIPKKDVTTKASNTSSTMSTANTTAQQSQTKKITRRSSKPIINWFQRKLAGTVRARRVSESQRYGASSPRDKEKRRSYVPPPIPLAIQPPRARDNTAVSGQGKAHSLRGTISLNETNDPRDNRSLARSNSARSSAAPESFTSFNEADEDASVRPLPPSSPPSPSPSRDSSSYLSHSRTFRSMTASTKPTTVLSVDLPGGGMAHIAQAPPTPTNPGHRIPAPIRTHSSGPSAGSITFSAILPQSPANPSRPSSGNSGATGAHGATLTAPQYTTHHPRNNPRPSSPPLDDASVLTLASSAFGMPGARAGLTPFTRGSFVDDSVSQWSNVAGHTDSTSHFMMTGDLEEGMEEERYNDHDASVRALRPRSSRRGSWDSAVSGWSANVGNPSPGGLRNKSMWTSGSFRTGGGFSTEAAEEGYAAMHEEGEGDTKSEDDTEDQPISRTTGVASSGQIPLSIAVEPSSESTSTEDVQMPPTPQAGRMASTLCLPGSKADITADMASTMTLPGSKAVSEVALLEDASEKGSHRSQSSTPTKAEVAAVELSAATEALKLEEKKERAEAESHRLSAQLSPASTTTTFSHYLSAPSSPMPVI